jgi:hypothetical protein
MFIHAQAKSNIFEDKIGAWTWVSLFDCKGWVGDWNDKPSSLLCVGMNYDHKSFVITSSLIFQAKAKTYNSVACQSWREEVTNILS